MLSLGPLGAHISALSCSTYHAPLLQSRRLSPAPTAPASAAAASCAPRSLCFLRRRSSRFAAERARRPTMAAAISLEAGGGLAHDLGSAAVTASVALALLKFFEELAKRGVFEQVSGYALRVLCDVSRLLFALIFADLARLRDY